MASADFNTPDSGKTDRRTVGKFLKDYFAEITRRFNLIGAGKIAVEGGQVKTIGGRPITARLDAPKKSGASPYPWIEVVGDSTGAWVVPTGARQGTDAYEANGHGGLGQTIVTLIPSEAGDYRFYNDGLCDCPQTLCVYLKCTGTTTPINGATVTLKDHLGTVLATGTSGYEGNGKGAVFNGTDAGLSCSDTAVVRSAEKFYVAFWMKPDSVTGTKTIFRKTNDAGEDWAVFQKNDTVRFQLTSYSATYEVTTGSVLSAGTWTHVLAYVDASVEQIGIIINAGAPTTASATKATLSATKTWTFDSTMDGWSFVPTSGTTTGAVWTGSDGSPSTGCVQYSTTDNNADGYWFFAISSWTQLNLPAGKTPTSIRLDSLKTKAYAVPAGGGGPGG